MSDIKPIGWKPDGTHVNKPALIIIVCILLGAYCTFSDAPFGNTKTHTITKDMGDK